MARSIKSAGIEILFYLILSATDLPVSRGAQRRVTPRDDGLARLQRALGASEQLERAPQSVARHVHCRTRPYRSLIVR
jgi:hypothetical protein